MKIAVIKEEEDVYIEYLKLWFEESPLVMFKENEVQKQYSAHNLNNT